jgi:hypothetical protein
MNEKIAMLEYSIAQDEKREAVHYHLMIQAAISAHTNRELLRELIANETTK